MPDPTSKRQREDDAQRRPAKRKMISVPDASEDAYDQLEHTIYTRYIRTVDVVVGAKRTPYTIHARVLHERCPQMLQIFYEWEVKLEDQDEPYRPFYFSSVVDEVFRLFLVWLYTDNILPSSIHRSPHDVSARLASGAAFKGRIVRGKTVDGDTNYYEDLDLVRLHQFGTVHGAPEVSNAALSCLAARHERLKCTTAVCAIKEVHAMQPRNSLLNLCLVEEAARLLTFRNIPRNLEQYPGAFVQKVFQRKLDPRKIKVEGMSLVDWSRRVCDGHFTHGARRRKLCEETCVSPSEVTDPRLLSCNDFESMVTIAVGTPPLVFSVHERLICRRSEFFDRAFRGGFAESGTKTLQLPDEAVGVIATFLDWLYTGRLTELSEVDQKAYRQYVDDLAARAAIKAASEPEDHTLANVPKLLETHMDLRRMMDVENAELGSMNPLDFDWSGDLDAHENATDKRAPPPVDRTRPLSHNSRLCAMVDLFVFAERTSQAFEILPACSKLLDWMVQEAAFSWSQLDFSMAETSDAYPPGFVDAAIRELLKHSKYTQTSSWRDKLCTFHEHLDDAGRQACQAKHEKWYVEVDDEAERVREPQKEFGIPHGRGWRIQASPLFICYLEGMAEDTA
ncbi:hypothetical protein LTR97_012091 [Elasticomyces elasticus]|uniref:BTB domain-containing protein n=1 Tax=Elasticomyces elasticus TaxID=574655 RepID=A0AAN7VM50_9PEZI|nr:hypothetical protein LTR97_012091 [Elasticomyces elasticus]